jgi:KDO2-lipid IV(A) lauroyltransferase
VAKTKETRSAPLIGAAARVLLSLGAVLPIGMVQRLGSVLGRFAFTMPTRLREVSRLNVAMCLPELSSEEQTRLVRRSLEEAGRTALEMAALWARPLEWSERLIDEVLGGGLLERAVDAGRGVILLLPHLGNWELFSTYLQRQQGFLALYRPARIREVDELMLRARRRSGCTLVPATAGGVRRLLRGLRAGRLAVILPDQEPVRDAGGFAPFFGIPALTMTLVCRLLQRTSAVPLVGVAERRQGGRFHLEIQQAPVGLDDPDLAAALARLNRAVEDRVRDCPEQYQWSYKRFKTRPPGELTPYRRRSFLPENLPLLDPEIRTRLEGVDHLPRS